MPRVALRPQARADLTEIWHYLAAEAGADRADDYLRRLAQALEYLNGHPQMGRERPELAERVRSFPFESHVIFYVAARTEGVEVVRIIHGSRDLEASWRPGA